MILDTNALSAFADGDEDLLHAIAARDELALPVIVLGEYLFGIHHSRLRGRYEQWLDTNLPFFSVLTIGRETATHYAEIRRELKNAGQLMPSNDLWIAALAREHRLSIVTRDKHFRTVRGLRLLTW